MRSYAVIKDEFVCIECVKKDPVAYLESLEHKPNMAETMEIDLEKYDYCCLSEDLENGLYGGQMADPKVIGEVLKKMGIRRYLFQLDSVGQFDCAFSVYVHQDEMEKVNKEVWRSAKKTGEDPAKMLDKALREITPRSSQNSNGVTVHTCNPDGTVTTKEVSKQDFIEGKVLD